MALAPCRECSRKVAADATLCPGCGIADPVDPTSWPNWVKKQVEAGRRREDIRSQLVHGGVAFEAADDLLDRHEGDFANREEPRQATRAWREYDVGLPGLLKRIPTWHWGKILLLWVAVGILFIAGGGSLAFMGAFLVIPISWIWVSGREA